MLRLRLQDTVLTALAMAESAAALWRCLEAFLTLKGMYVGPGGLLACEEGLGSLLGVLQR